MKKYLSLFMCMLIFFSMPILSCAIYSDYSDIFKSAKSAIVIDAGSGDTIYEKNADEQSLIASTTKIMTASVVLEKCSIDEIVTVPAEAVGVEGSSAYLNYNEKLSVRELLYCLLLPSGNDAAVALAIHTAGNIEGFASLMNEKAQSFGMTSSHFENPHGLDGERHYSTARDMATLTKYAMENETFRSIVSAKTVTVGNRTLTNHNKLLWSVEGMTGVKTGYTKAAGRILITSVERDGVSIICVTIGDSDDFEEHRRLYEKVFSEFLCERICSKGELFGSIPVISGKSESVDVVFSRDVTLIRKSEDVLSFETEMSDFAYGNINKGDILGCIKIIINGEVIDSVDLIAKNGVETDDSIKLNLWEKLKRMLRISFKYGGNLYPQW